MAPIRGKKGTAKNNNGIDKQPSQAQMKDKENHDKNLRGVSQAQKPNMKLAKSGTQRIVDARKAYSDSIRQRNAKSKGRVLIERDTNVVGSAASIVLNNMEETEREGDGIAKNDLNSPFRSDPKSLQCILSNEEITTASTISVQRPSITGFWPRQSGALSLSRSGLSSGFFLSSKNRRLSGQPKLSGSRLSLAPGSAKRIQLLHNNYSNESRFSNILSTVKKNGCMRVTFADDIINNSEPENGIVVKSSDSSSGLDSCSSSEDVKVVDTTGARTLMETDIATDKKVQVNKQKSRRSEDVRQYIGKLSPETFARFSRLIKEAEESGNSNKIEEGKNKAAAMIEDSCSDTESTVLSAHQDESEIKDTSNNSNNSGGSKDSSQSLLSKSRPLDRLSVIPESPAVEEAFPLITATPKVNNSQKIISTPFPDKKAVMLKENKKTVDGKRMTRHDSAFELLSAEKGTEEGCSLFFCRPASATDMDSTLVGREDDEDFVNNVKTPTVRRPFTNRQQETTPPLLIDHEILPIKPPVRTPLFLRSNQYITKSSNNIHRLPNESSKSTNTCLNQNKAVVKPPLGSIMNTNQQQHQEMLNQSDMTVAAEFSSVFKSVVNSTAIDDNITKTTQPMRSLPPIDLSPIKLSSSTATSEMKARTNDNNENQNKNDNGRLRRKCSSKRRSIVAQVMCDQEVMLTNERPAACTPTERPSRPNNPIATFLTDGDNTFFQPIGR